MQNQPDPADELLFIPVEVVRWILAHRRRRLAAEAKQETAEPEAGETADSTAKTEAMNQDAI